MVLASGMRKIEGHPDSSEVIPGMAFFPNTGPFGRTCGECISRGYARTSASGVTRRYQGCAMFKKMAGTHGPVIDADNSACKYFEAKPEPKK